MISCGECYGCKRGCNNGEPAEKSAAPHSRARELILGSNSRTACAKLGFVGLSGLGGGLAEYFASPEEYLHRLPDNVSLKSGQSAVVTIPGGDPGLTGCQRGWPGAMCEPLAVAIHAVRRSGFQKGMTALVLGAGPIGLFITKVLLAQGAS